MLQWSNTLISVKTCRNSVLTSVGREGALTHNSINPEKSLMSKISLLSMKGFRRDSLKFWDMCSQSDTCTQVLCCWFGSGPSAPSPGPGRAELLRTKVVATNKQDQYQLKTDSNRSPGAQNCTTYSRWGRNHPMVTFENHPKVIFKGPFRPKMFYDSRILKLLQGSGKQHASSYWAYSWKKMWLNLVPEGCATPVGLFFKKNPIHFVVFCSGLQSWLLWQAVGLVTP